MLNKCCIGNKILSSDRFTLTLISINDFFLKARLTFTDKLAQNLGVIESSGILILQTKLNVSVPFNSLYLNAIFIISTHSMNENTFKS